LSRLFEIQANIFSHCITLVISIVLATVILNFQEKMKETKSEMALLVVMMPLFLNSLVSLGQCSQLDYRCRSYLLGPSNSTR
jgi:hypothetical protein